MLDLRRSLVAVRLVAGAAIVALAVAACGGSSASPSPASSGAAASAAPTAAATPAPTSPPTPEQSQAGGGTTTSGCADPESVAAALKNVDHYVASAKIAAAVPGASGLDLTLDMTMKYQKPDRMEISSGMGGAATLFAMKTIGADSWISMFGSDMWTKSDDTTSNDDPNIFGSSLDAGDLKPLDEIPADLVLPGSSSCVIGYSMTIPTTGATDDSGNPLSSLSGATAFAMRVDTGTGLPESMGFLIDPAKAGEGSPTSMVFVFDYQTPVDIQPPDPSKVGEGGFPFPSGFELPSGMDLP